MFYKRNERDGTCASCATVSCSSFPRSLARRASSCSRRVVCSCCCASACDVRVEKVVLKLSVGGTSASDLLETEGLLLQVSRRDRTVGELNIRF